MRPTALRLAIGAVVASLLCLAGCAPTSVALPEGVTVSVFQNRSDYATRTLVIGVVNGSESPITLDRAVFSSPRFDGEAEWSRGTTLRAGGQVDLRVAMPESVCGVEGEPTVTLEFETDAGRGTATVTPVDDRGRLDEVNRDECLGDSAGAIARLSLESLEWTPGAAQPAMIELTATPTGDAGELTIASVAQTVLLALVDDDARVEQIAVDARLDATSAPLVVALHFVPSRCDPHAVAEDKRGTFLPVEVSITGGDSGIVYVAASDEQRVEIYDFIGDYCGY